MSVKPEPSTRLQRPALIDAFLRMNVESVRRFVSAAIDTVLPPRCSLCGVEGTFLCDTCLEGIPDLALDTQETRARSLWSMEGPARNLVHQFKYRGLRALARPLGLEMAGLVRKWDIDVDLVTHVPLHRSRLRRRGYDQARELAEVVGEEMHLPFVTALVRTGKRSSQVETGTRGQRMRNVQHAFHVPAGSELTGMRVLLVDDVTTTGATLTSASEALRGAGAERIFGVTVTREL